MKKNASQGIFFVVAGGLCALLVGVAACTAVLPTPTLLPAQEAPVRETDQAAPAPPKALTLNPKKSAVGAEIEASAEGLPPGKTVDLIWETVQGGWVVENYYNFRGKQYSEARMSLGQSEVGADGRLATRFTVPEDYGGVHNVVVSADSVSLAQGGLDLTQSFAMSPQDGPVGTLIELRVKGLGWTALDSTWVVNWDNQAAGWVSAADTRGSAVARFRASGPPGDHEIKVYTGWAGQSYLNFEQAPNAYLPRPRFVFRTTPGAGVPPGGYVEPYQQQPVPPSESRAGSSLQLTPTQGPVLTRAQLTGNGFPANKELTLIWTTWVGSRVSGTGYAPKDGGLGKVTVDVSGRIDVPLQIPDDLGGLHTLILKDGDQEAGRTNFAIETSIVSITPTSGPVGTPISIHLKGVGWTEYDNILIANYDNAYMGYACGFNSQGDVVINFTAAGAPGIHLIDLYPGIYQGPDQFKQQLYRLPQLTYADDHPGNKIPALRFAFEVTP